MNYTQNEKIEQVTDTTMVVGETFKSKFHCPLMRWNLLLHE